MRAASAGFAYPDPRHRGRGVERHVERCAARIGHDATRLLQQHRGAHVVRVAGERVGIDEWAEVGDEAVVTRR